MPACILLLMITRNTNCSLVANHIVKYNVHYTLIGVLYVAVGVLFTIATVWLVPPQCQMLQHIIVMNV